MNRLTWMRLMQPVIARFPGVSYRLATVAGRIVWRLRPELRRRVSRTMLPLCDGDRARARRAGLRAVQNVAMYFVDLATLPRRDMSRFEAEHLEVYHDERLKILEEPGPLIVVSAHTGNAELAIQAISHRGRSIVALVEAQEPPEWSAYMLGLRKSAGGRFEEANLAGVRVLLGGLKRGEAAGLMGDRDLQGNGMCTPFFGRTVRLPRGPWELARRTNARVLPVFSSRKRRDQFRVYVGEPFTVSSTEDEEGDIRTAICHYVGLVERHLRRDPGQWTVLEDFWRNHRCG